MALGALAIANLVAQGGKALFGLGQGIVGASKQKKLWADRPQLGVTAGEKEATNLFKQSASATELPGQRRAEEKLGQTYAEGVSDAQKTATSSLGATKSAVDLAGKKMDAIQSLAGSFAEYKAQRQDALANWDKQRVGLENERFQYNIADPFAMKYGESIGKKQEGFSSALGSVDKGLGYLNDLQGTQQYMDILKSLYPNLGE